MAYFDEYIQDLWGESSGIREALYLHLEILVYHPISYIFNFQAQAEHEAADGCQ